MSDVDLIQNYIDFLKKAFAYNSLVIEDDDLQLCINHFLPKARD